MRFEQLASTVVGQTVHSLKKRHTRSDTVYDLFDEGGELIKTISKTSIMMHVENSPCSLEFAKPWDDPDFIDVHIGGSQVDD